MEEDKRKRYQINCPYCGKAQYACKSMLHEMRYYEAGRGTCMNCKGFMKLICNPESDTMTAEEWETVKADRKGGLFG